MQSLEEFDQRREQFRPLAGLPVAGVLGVSHRVEDAAQPGYFGPARQGDPRRLIAVAPAQRNLRQVAERAADEVHAAPPGQQEHSHRSQRRGQARGIGKSPDVRHHVGQANAHRHEYPLLQGRGGGSEGNQPLGSIAPAGHRLAGFRQQREPRQRRRQIASDRVRGAGVHCQHAAATIGQHRGIASRQQRLKRMGERIEAGYTRDNPALPVRSLPGGRRGKTWRTGKQSPGIFAAVTTPGPGCDHLGIVRLVGAYGLRLRGASDDPARIEDIEAQPAEAGAAQRIDELLALGGSGDRVGRLERGHEQRIARSFDEPSVFGRHK